MGSTKSTPYIAGANLRLVIKLSKTMYNHAALLHGYKIEHMTPATIDNST